MKRGTSAGALSLGERVASGLGHRPGLIRLLVIVAVALLVGAATATAGDAVASGLGLRITQRRWQVLVVSVLLTGLAVAVAGPVGLVGLIGPEIARSLSSPRGVPVVASALTGALVMVLANVRRAGRFEKAC
jgi:ABC-type Fe3+-siderophore transport system permease subunit